MVWEISRVFPHLEHRQTRREKAASLSLTSFRALNDANFPALHGVEILAPSYKRNRLNQMFTEVLLQLFKSSLQCGKDRLVTSRPMSEQQCSEFSFHLGPNLANWQQGLRRPWLLRFGFIRANMCPRLACLHSTLMHVTPCNPHKGYMKEVSLLASGEETRSQGS